MNESNANIESSARKIVANMKKAELNMVLMAIVMGILVLVFALAIRHQFTRIARLQKEVDYANKTYLVESGWIKIWGTDTNGTSYNLRSFDGGQNWYAASVSSNGVIILGEAEKIYPGLHQHLTDMDTLTEYCTKHGPLTLTNDSEIKMPENIGFTVTHKHQP